MTVKELIETLNTYPQDENIYVWATNWPSECHSTNLELKRPYGSILTVQGKIVGNSPLIIGAKYE